MRHVIASALVALGTVVGCNFHSGSGLDPDAILHADQGAGASGGDSGDNEGGSGSGSGGSTSGGGGSGGGSGGGTSSGTTSSGASSGGASSSSGGSFPDASVGSDGGAPVEDSGFDSNGATDQGCVAKGNGCYSCCESAYTSGWSQWAAPVHMCVCTTGGGGGGACSGPCAGEFCTNGMITSDTDACGTCVAQETSAGGGCSRATTACMGNPTCAAFLTCYQGCSGGP